ncbi:TolC family protein [Oscillatoria amoena NRMC-F 0135]|nr:TolC family protein [Oscillatoria amoena NRMC-F 0135]
MRWFVLLLLAAICFAQPMTIEQIRREAVENNLRLLADRFEISIAEARILQARLRPNPVFTAEANYLDILGAGINPNINTAGPTEFSARVDFILERGKKRRERIAAAEGSKAVAQMELADRTRTLLLDVDTAFADLLLAEANLDLARMNRDTFDRIVAINRTRVDAGDLARVELVRSEVAALSFQNQVRQAEQRVRSAKIRLQALMGRRLYNPQFAVTGELRRDSLPVEREELRAAAFSARPDLLALQRDQARSLAELRSQIAQGKVDYTIGAGVNRQTPVAGYNGGNTAGVFFSMPLPVFNRNEGEIERARQEQRQIEARIRSLEQEITAELENAYLQAATAFDLLQRIETEMLAQAKRVREVIEFSYRRGEATFVEFLDAQRAYNETVEAHNEARAEYARNLILLDAIAGKEPKY